MIDRGRNWARYLFLIGFILGIFMYVNSTINGFSFGTLDFLLAISQTGLQSFALVKLFTSPGNKWFKKQNKLRHQHFNS